ncbi:MAG: class I SAM-dependent methyltransferase [Sandaracinus sp.]
MSETNSREMQPVRACVLCGTAERIPVKGVSWKGLAFSYSICGRCGHKYMDPAPTPASLDAFFKEQYWQDNLSAEGFPTNPGYDDKSLDQLALRQEKYRISYEHVRRDTLAMRPITRQTRFLEVGCAFGYTLEYLHRDFGCVVHGIEPSDAAIERCRQPGTIELVERSAEAFFVGKGPVAPENRYDVIVFRHVLETLLDPKPVLRGVREYLKEDGLLLIYSPNVEYYDLMSPFTPHCYSPETMRRLLACAGLDVTRLVAPESPVDRATALRVKPSYEMVVFGRRGAARDVEHPKVAPLSIVRRIELGNAASKWNQLFAGDLAVLFRNKLRDRLGRRR